MPTSYMYTVDSRDIDSLRGKRLKAKKGVGKCKPCTTNLLVNDEHNIIYHHQKLLKDDVIYLQNIALLLFYSYTVCACNTVLLL